MSSAVGFGEKAFSAGEIGRRSVHSMESRGYLDMAIHDCGMSAVLQVCCSCGGHRHDAAVHCPGQEAPHHSRHPWACGGPPLKHKGKPSPSVPPYPNSGTPFAKTIQQWPAQTVFQIRPWTPPELHNFAGLAVQSLIFKAIILSCLISSL